MSWKCVSGSDGDAHFRCFCVMCNLDWKLGAFMFPFGALLLTPMNATCISSFILNAGLFRILVMEFSFCVGNIAFTERLSLGIGIFCFSVIGFSLS